MGREPGCPSPSIISNSGGWGADQAPQRWLRVAGPEVGILELQLRLDAQATVRSPSFLPPPQVTAPPGLGALRPRVRIGRRKKEAPDGSKETPDPMLHSFQGKQIINILALTPGDTRVLWAISQGTDKSQVILEYKILLLRERQVEKSRQPSPPPSLAWFPSGLQASCPLCHGFCLDSTHEPHDTGQILQFPLWKMGQDSSSASAGEHPACGKHSIYAGGLNGFAFLPSL